MFPNGFQLSYGGGSRPADPYGANARKPARFYLIVPGNPMSPWIHRLAEFKEHLPVGGIPATDKQNQVMFPGKR